MRRIALGLACLVAVGGYVIGCGSTSGTANGNNHGGSGGSGTGATGGGATGGNAGSGNVGGSGASSSGGSGATGSGGSGATGSGGADASSSGGSGATGSQDASVPDVVFSYDGPSDDGKQEACADLQVKAQPTPLDMYVMLDQSGSMGTDCNIGAGTNSKWCHAINALSGFFHDSSATGDRVALQYFMLDSGGTCAGAGYDTPAVPLGYLPQIAGSLDSSMNSHSPHTDTPTEAAMNGIAKYTSTHQTAGRVMVGILITDGVPCCGECNDNVATIAKIPQNLYNNFGIRTFVIGMTGASFPALEQWAVAGGGPSHSNYCASGYSTCHFYNVGNGDKTAFINALKAIQQSALGCQFNMPKTDAGIVDPSKLAVQFTPSGASPQTLPNAGSKAGCNGDGFYYDNNQTPTTITLCPATCTKAGTGGTVNITVPCQGS